MNLNFNKNEDHNKLLLSDLRKRYVKVKLGGGASKIEKQHAMGKMTARERIDYLLDSKSKSLEIGAFAGDGMYLKHGGCPSAGEKSEWPASEAPSRCSWWRWTASLSWASRRRGPSVWRSNATPWSVTQLRG